MTRDHRPLLRRVALAALAASSCGAQAFTFDTGTVRGNLDSSITAGMGVRAKNPSC